MTERIWSDYQKAIFEDAEKGQGNTCVEAVAGSGKSSTLIESLNRMPKKAATLVTSFSKACVDDLQAKEPPWTVDLRTLNSLGFRALLKKYPGLKVDPNRGFKVVEEVVGPLPSGAVFKEYASFKLAVKRMVDVAKGHLAKSSEELDSFGEDYEINTVTPESLRASLNRRLDCEKGDEFAATVFRCLEESKRIKGKIDFNDQLYLPIAFDAPFEQFDRICADEAQDLSPVQIEMLYRSMRKDCRISMYGDDRQAIFGFRGAGIGMGPFVRRLNAKKLPLSISYRCPKSVVKLAKTFVSQIESAPDAIEGSVETMRRSFLLDKTQAGDVVISRSNSPLLSVFLECARRRMPVGINGEGLGLVLKGMVDESRAKSLDDLRHWVGDWATKEKERKKKLHPDARLDAIEDREQCIRVLADGAESIVGLYSIIEQLMIVPKPGEKLILSSTHRAKGLEWNRVFVLNETYAANPCYWKRYATGLADPAWCRGKADLTRIEEPEEANLVYVAWTRSKRELFLVEGMFE